MKKIIAYSYIIVLLIFSYGCEEVVDVELQNDEPKLVIDAVIKWQKETAGETQTIKLSLTNDFYSSEIVFAKGALVTVTNSSNTIFNFIEVPDTGDYVCNNFVPVINEEYTLHVQYNGQNYSSTNKLYATPNIEYVEQQVVPDIDGSDIIQVKFYYQDNPDEDNFYLIGVKNPNKRNPDYGVMSDEFFQGNIMFGFYYSDDTTHGSTLLLQLQGISNGYYDYMNKLITISSTNSGNPYSTPPATVRGNIVNETDPDNYPLGYFSLGEVDLLDYLVQ
ncbi:lipoprotein precursor [Flavobacterium enshiense DK69]|uniref:DUF4249 domain-containing protein n=1 Tax=Flavobacterium enshiense DK69 TaxID=1107311 RepID=V6S7S8_9FLAO|nr:DUF4249 domain-containing protein [Flavobacterium enshiense]ESU22686.1 lipoprotein precursor [Flavobacterium enshiense DK69]KGO95615.1 hypothetical protein Q767_10325 [Flavobacterium enshiense DK69]